MPPLVSASLHTSGDRLARQGEWLTVWCFYVYIHARIKPSNAFRVVLKVAKYSAHVEYGLVEMAEQEHELWLVGAGDIV